MARAARRKKKKPTERELKELELFGALKALLEELGWRVNLAGTLDGRGVYSAAPQSGDSVGLGRWACCRWS